MPENLDYLKPKRKAQPSDAVIGGASIGIPVAVVIPWLAGHFGLAIPVEIAGAMGALVTAIISYFPRGGRQD